MGVWICQVETDELGNRTGSNRSVSIYIWGGIDTDGVEWSFNLAHPSAIDLLRIIGPIWDAEPLISLHLLTARERERERESQ